MGRGLGLPSIETATSLMLGPRKRNVTRLSEWTSGETSGGGGVCARPAMAVSKNASKRKNVRFMVPRRAAALIQISVPEPLRRGMIQQAADGFRIMTNGPAGSPRRPVGNDLD